MENINATNFRKNVFEYLNSAILYGDVVNVTTKNGNAVLISEEDYNGLIETVYLLDSGLKDRLEEGLVAPEEDFEDFEW